MDFFTTHAVPVSINIDGTAYQVPRFLMPAFKAWAAELVKRQRDTALSLLPQATAEDKARFVQYWPEPTFDIVTLCRNAVTPEGASYVVNAQLRAANVPDEVREKVIALGDPVLIRELAMELCYVPQTLAKLGVEESEKSDPLPSAPDTSGAVQETGAAITPDSSPATAA